jgi:hypothetical protein
MAETRAHVDAFSGRCLCGAVSYTVKAGPAAQVLCYCDMCRRATGAPVPGFISVAADTVTWTGQPAIYRSSDVAERGFCARCGSTLFYRSDGSGTIGLAAGAADTTFEPTHAFYRVERPGWLTSEEHLTDPGFTPGPRET